MHGTDLQSKQSSVHLCEVGATLLVCCSSLLHALECDPTRSCGGAGFGALLISWRILLRRCRDLAEPHRMRRAFNGYVPFDDRVFRDYSDLY